MLYQRLFIFILMMVSFSSNAASLANKIDSFKKEFQKKDAVEIYDIRLIQKEYPTVLLSPDTFLLEPYAKGLNCLQAGLHDLA